MADPVRFHLDEHMPRALARELRRRGLDITTMPEEGLIKASDDSQIDYGQRAGRVILTDDVDFLRIAAARPDHAGIIYCQRANVTIGQIIDFLLACNGVYTAAEMVGRVEFLKG